jgi:hypothetical protein
MEKETAPTLKRYACFFYIYCSNIQEKSNKTTYFAENLKRQVFPMQAM